MQLTLALGTNLGNREQNLARARQSLMDYIGPLVARTAVVETPAWGVTDQPAFLNQVIVLDATRNLRGAHRAGARLTGKALVDQLHRWLDVCQHIEQTGGRERKLHWGPRTIDIDLIFADDVHFEDHRLSLPHPWWNKRDFVGGLLQRELADLFPQHYPPQPRLEEVLPSPTPFLEAFFAALPPQIHHLPIDHLCYRVANQTDYHNYRDALVAAGHELLTEAPISGRPIATFRLLTPVRFRGQAIHLLELPAPKTGSPYPAGYEHAEMVVDQSLPKFERWLLQHTTFAPEDLDQSGRNKPLNADLRIRLDHGMSIKFHEKPLDEIISIEQGQ
ncbi:2-amino-4-hydroxy-6-hydroxymethyldihydropteridine diphosphokinase [Lewinella sp. W8]|uniref:2-amino-4-hydroxy-6- hydroxymethyldihydropteridine diphosphokinase n=1 Tax=Lewinella sp. W8 TaxID=2528208 RepID=UPI00156458E6|nr:2-amino-4-hydroxy-6-hydroxymethyldihydropteridine diphosphokinase [Lewinella sp. W8]